MATSIKDVNHIQQIPRNEIRLLWHADFWDGPINGLCLWANKKCWFEMLTEDNDDSEASTRRYLVFELSGPQVTEEEHWHELFRLKVGTHCDYDEPHPEVKPQASHREFYEAYASRPKPDYSSNRVIGWFELS